MGEYDHFTQGQLISLVCQLEAGRRADSNTGSGNPAGFPIFGAEAQRAFEGSASPMRIFDLETLQYLAVNAAAVKFYGYTREEFLNLTVRDTRHPDEHPELPAAIAEQTGYLRHRPPRRQVKKSGEVVVVERITQDILFNGRKARLSLTLDISARLHMQELLWQRQQEFETLTENSPDIICRIDRSYRHLYVNPAITAATGRSPDKFIGKTVGEIGLTPELTARWYSVLNEAFTTESEKSLECAFDAPNGESYYESRIIPERGSGGGVETVLVITRDITERKKAEDELRHQKNLLAAIIDNLPVGVFIRDAETLRYVLRNRFCERSNGYPVETSMGKTAYDLFPKEQADLSTATDRKALASRKMQEVPEQEMLARSGEQRIYHVRKVPLFSDDGRPWLVVGIMDDITERKRAERVLRETNEFLYSVIESSRDSIAVLDLEGRLQLMNAAGRHLLEADGLVRFFNISWFDLWRETDRETVRSAIMAARSGGVGTFEAYGPTLKGTAKWWDVTVTPVLGADDKPTRLLTVSRDITGRKQAQDVQGRLAAIVDSSTDAVISKDLDGVIRTWNPAAERLFGYRSEEAIGQPVAMLIPSDRKDEENLIMERIRRGERVEHIETLRRRQDGTLVDVSLTTSPIRDAAGQIVGASKIVRDITEHKQAELAALRSAELARLLESLARAANEAVTPEAAMAACLELICKHGGWVLGRVELFDENGEPEKAPGRSIWHATDRERFAEFIRISNGRVHYPTGPFMGRVVRERMAIWIEDVEQTPDFRRKEPAIKHRLRSAFAFPIMAHGDVVALMEVFSEERRGRDPLMMGAAETLASQLARIIERERAHEANARMAAIIESSQDAIVSRRLDGMVVTWNPAAERLFGYTAAEIVGRNLDLIVPPELRQEKAERQTLLERGVAIPGIETVRVAKDGRRIDASISPAPIRDASGEIWGISSIIRDIAERKAAEEALRKSEERFRQLAENIRQVFWISTLSLDKLIYVSPAYEEIWGRSRESLYQDSRSWMDAIHAEDAPRVRASAQKMAQGSPLNVEYRIVRPDGAVRWIRDRSYHVKHGDGPMLAYGLAEDITDWKRAELELRQTQQHLQVAVHGGNVGLWDWDVETGAVFFSRELKQQLGHKDSEIPNRFEAWESRLHPEDRERVTAAIKECLARPGSDFQEEYRLRHKDSSYRWILSRASAQLGKNGKVEHMFGAHVDITERKQAETERLENAMRQRDALVREVHHRIKNSLQGVVGLLRQKIRKHPAIAVEIEEAVGQLQSVALVYGLQETRLDGLVSLSEITDAVCASAESLIGGRVNRTFERNSRRPACVAGAEAVSVAVALNELVFNALKHQPAEAGKKRARVTLCETKGAAKIRITNRGRLPKGFDFAGGRAVGNGLGLVRTLLASPGGSIVFSGGRNEVAVTLTLTPPLLADRRLTLLRRKENGGARQKRAAAAHPGGGRRPAGVGRAG
jgi:PAS domain S-box-containing protein